MCQMLLLGEKNVGHSMTPIRPKLHALGVFGEKLPNKTKPYYINASSLIPPTKKTKTETKKTPVVLFPSFFFRHGRGMEWNPLIFPCSE